MIFNTLITTIAVGIISLPFPVVNAALSPVLAFLFFTLPFVGAIKNMNTISKDVNDLKNMTSEDFINQYNIQRKEQQEEEKIKKEKYEYGVENATIHTCNGVKNQFCKACFWNN